jgi:hypothetical protein
MRTVIKELWEFSITNWKQRNAELHGTTNDTISMEQQRKDTYPQWTVLCFTMLADILKKWTKEHLDAYLASIDRCDKPG